MTQKSSPYFSELRADSVSHDVVLSIAGLRTTFRTDAGEVAAVDGVNISLRRGKTLAIVGESGCGKSMLSLSIMQLLPGNGRVSDGRIDFEGKMLVGVPEAEMQAIRGKRIAMIFQEPMTSLNPAFTIGNQIIEAIRAHDKDVTFSVARERAIKALKRVGIPAAERRVDEYPHQLSGGMRQRVMIAMALVCEPEVLIADEPTTALDVTVQAQILELLKSLQNETGMSIILITHDLGVVAEMADDMAVMYAGRIVETGSVSDVFDDPQHPYTLGLLGSTPKISEDAKRLVAIKGSVPPLFRMPTGCRFHPRCDFCIAECKIEGASRMSEISEGHFVACIRAPVEENCRELAE
ncbi:ABC transporter ATP-binding protein [Microvirga flavescens]|uniref:ABC transporter ATP-binding protein n=1 Tax=Microvirga flavescens TaxID=2249811 RepID=UPI000DD6BEE8|nr:ABC transporter ATP-binding protein [Microvirga flavescens]